MIKRYEKISKNVPCREKVMEIIHNELESGNIIKDYPFNVGGLPDESHYVLLFKYDTKLHYDDLKVREKADGSKYRCLTLVGNGCIEVCFGF